MTLSKETKAKNFRQQLRAYQILMHLLYHKTEHTKYLPDKWIRIIRPTKYASKFQMSAVGLRAAIEKLRKAGYVSQWHHGKNRVDVKLNPPVVWEVVRTIPEGANPDKMPALSTPELPPKPDLDKERHQIKVPKPVPEVTQEWNPETLQFEPIK